MKILLVGDSHGDLAFLKDILRWADEVEADQILQLGDFGYWEHHPEGVQFLDGLQEACEATKRTLHWIDGNHENHRLLRSRYNPEGFTPIRPNIIYIPRATRWHWGGLDFVALGGAYSIDKQSRLSDFRAAEQHLWKTGRYEELYQYESWWPEETPTDEEVALASMGGTVDVVVAHDVPVIADVFWEYQKQRKRTLRPMEGAIESQRKCQDLFEAVQPSYWFHGHYHFNYHTKVNGCLFTGLDCNMAKNQAEALYLLDTKALPLGNWQRDASLETVSPNSALDDSEETPHG